MRDSQIFSERADAAQADADVAVLDNVRDRCLRAHKAWSEMAERSRRMEVARDQRAAPTVLAEG